MRKFLSAAAALGSVLVPALAFGQIAPPTGATLPTNPTTDVGGVLRLICLAVAWMFWALIILAIIFVLLAAFGYVTSAGDPEKTGKAKKQIIYAAVAVAVAAFARVVPTLVANLIGATGTFTSC